MKGTVCQLNYYGGGCLRSVHPGPDGSNCEAAWPFATAPLGLKVGDAVTFTLTEGGQAVDLQVTANEPKTERDPELAAMTSPRTDGEADPTVRPDEPKIPLKRGLEPTAAQRKLQRQMSRFQNANLEEQIEMLQRAEDKLNGVKPGDQMEGATLCSVLNELAGFLHAPGETIAVASGAGEASAVAGVKNAGLQQKVRKLLIRCLERLDLTDNTTYESVAWAVKHIAELVKLQMPNQNRTAEEDGPSSLRKKRKLAVDQWQTLAALVGTRQDNALPSGKRGDMSSTKHYQPGSRVRNLPSVFEDDLNPVTLKCSECEQTMTSTWFWRHPKNEIVHVLAPDNGHMACRQKMGRKCPWRSTGDCRSKLDNFDHLDYCEHKHPRSKCAACGGSGICEHKKQYSHCKLCKVKGQRQAARVKRVSEKGQPSKP